MSRQCRDGKPEIMFIITERLATPTTKAMTSLTGRPSIPRVSSWNRRRSDIRRLAAFGYINRRPDTETPLCVRGDLTDMDRRAAALVAIGGAAGAVSRHAIAVALSAAFPWGTLLVNVVGSFLLGIVAYGPDRNGALGERTRLVVSTGFVSSFTTYSAFAAETAGLDARLAALNVVGTYALGLSAVVAAAGVVRWRS